LYQCRLGREITQATLRSPSEGRSTTTNDNGEALHTVNLRSSGGVNRGFRYGATDEHGIAAVKDPMQINDLHATMLYMLGLDHEKLTYRCSGRDFRLTDLAGVVAKGVVT
jgi:hypothetical protein